MSINRFNLDPLQQGIMDMVLVGMTDKQIAEQLTYSESSARHDIGKILAILGVKTKLQAANLWRTTKNEAWLKRFGVLADSKIRDGKST